MTEEAGTPKPRARRTTGAKAGATGSTGSAGSTGSTARKPRAAKPKPPAERVEELASKAVEEGRKLLDTETGQKVAEAADKAFDKAEALTREALDKAGEMGRKAMENREAREAAETAKAIWNTPLGRNVGIGAGAGAALGIFILNPVIGALIGGGLGYLRTLTKK